MILYRLPISIKPYFRFVDKSKSEQPNYISIAKLDGCYSMGIGMSPDDDGKHLVSIGDGCAYTGTVLHEFMHAIGKKCLA